MISPVSSATQAQKVIQATPVKDKPAQAAAQTNTPTDAVEISSSAKTAAQELAETAAQTTQEANKGDLQAQRLMAKHAAERAIMEGKD